MTESQPLLERLEAVDATLERGEVQKALMQLVDIREAGFVNRELDLQITGLRGEKASVDGCRAWLATSIERVKQFGGDVFRDVEDLGESSLGFDKKSWVDVEDDVDGEFDLFDDLDDLLELSQLDGEELSRDEFSESTRLVGRGESDALVSESGLVEPSLGTQLESQSGKFPLPAPRPSQKRTGKMAGPNEPESPFNRETSQIDAVAPPTRDFEIEIGDDFDDPFSDLAEESNLRELTPLRGMEAIRQTEQDTPGDSGNPFADFMDLDESDSPTVRRKGFDSGPSVARYAGVAPPPPTHRLRGASRDDSQELTFNIESEPESDDDFDFDLGLDNPNASPPSKPFGDVSVGAGVADDDSFDFDLGLTNPNSGFGGPISSAQTKPNRSDAAGTKPGNDAKRTKPSDASETKPGDEQAPAREMQLTPLGISALSEKSDPIDEDEFFEIAESLAQESSSSDAPFRQRQNPFAHSAPTGVRHGPIEESSFVLEEASVGASVPVGGGTSTNLSAILMEARRMYEHGEFSSALDVCEKVISRGGNSEAEELRAVVQGELERIQLDKLGSLSLVPELAIPLNQLSSKDLDHRAGYLISQIDGEMAFEDLIELSSMSRLETLRVLGDLLDQSIIRVP